MLQEIFKGMDNASDVINDNFQYGGIVEDNLNETNPENGYYVNFGNGFQVCWHVMDITASLTYRADSVWTFPKPFTSKPAVFPAKPWFENGGAAESNYSVTARNDLENPLSGMAITVHRSGGNLEIGRVLKGVAVVAVGRWK